MIEPQSPKTEQTLSCALLGFGRFGRFWLRLLYQSRKHLVAMGKALLPESQQPFDKVEFLVYDEMLSTEQVDERIALVLKEAALAESAAGEQGAAAAGTGEQGAAAGEQGAAAAGTGAAVKAAGEQGAAAGNAVMQTADVVPTSALHAASIRRITKSELKAADILFFCLPISLLQRTAADILPHCSDSCLLIDTCSVKENPVKWISQSRKKTQPFLATHPLFGPDSYDGVTKRVIALWPAQLPDASYRAWMQFFSSMQLQPLTISPTEHDKTVAFTQGLTHLVGRILTQLHVEDYAVATKGYLSLREIITQTCNDSLELFFDLQCFNAHSEKMWEEFMKVSDALVQQLKKKNEELNHD